MQRGSLKLTHESFDFLDIVSGIEAKSRISASQLRLSVYRELLSKALQQCTPPPTYLRPAGTRTALGHATIRRSLGYESEENQSTALLTRSKTIGDQVNSFEAPHHRCSVLLALQSLDVHWMETTRRRDFLLPAPSTNHHGTIRSELRYAIAYTVQNRVLSSLSFDCSHVFSFLFTQDWTPHSSRTCLPSATLLLDFTKHQWDFLGGWSAPASDRYARTACRSITKICKG